MAIVDRNLESGLPRVLENGDNRYLESFVPAPPKLGSGTVTYTENPVAAGKETPKGQAPAVWTSNATAVGKRTPKATVPAVWTETIAATGKKAPKGINYTTVNFATLAAGTKLDKGTAVVDTTWKPRPALGTFPAKGVSAPAFYEWATDGAGMEMPEGSTSCDISFVQSGEGIEGVIGFFDLQWNGQLCDAMQFGDKAVVNWVLTPA